MTKEVDEARRYVAFFLRYMLRPGCEWAQTGSRRIYFNNMTDEEAVFIAAEFARMEIEAAGRAQTTRH